MMLTTEAIISELFRELLIRFSSSVDQRCPKKDCSSGTLLSDTVIGSIIGR